MRDITLNETFRHHFTTRQFSDGVPTALAGSPVMSVHEEGNDTFITAGVTLDVSIGSSPVIGLNEVAIVATAGNGYEAGKSYAIFISTGTVGGVSVVGEIVGHFTVGLSAAAVDLANATDGLTALRTLLLDLPTVSEFNARTILSADYFDAAADAVANVTLVATTSVNTDAFTAAEKDQIRDSLGVDGAKTAAIGGQVQLLALASVCTEVRLAELAAGNLPTDIADIPTVAEFNARTIVAATYALEATLGTPAGASVSVDIADIPTVSEFNARTILSAAYFDPAADDVDVRALQANVITAASIAAAAIIAAKFGAGAFDAAALNADAVDKIRDGILPTQNVAFDNIPVFFVAASDNVTAVTGATGVVVTRSIDGGAYGAATGTFAEISNGMYQFDASADDMNGGLIVFRFTATGGVPGAPNDRFISIVTGGGV